MQPQEWNMTHYQGFSLTEVLISLVLISSTSIALLRQQWQLGHVLNQTLTKTQVLIEFDNNNEKQLNAAAEKRAVLAIRKL